MTFEARGTGAVRITQRGPVILKGAVSAAFPEPWSSSSLAKKAVAKPLGQKCALDNAFALIGGRPSRLHHFDYL
jgi:hypothetical protein